MKKNKKYDIELIIAVLLFVWGILLFHEDRREISNISDEYSVTTAEIIDYKKYDGVGNGYYILYRYKIIRILFKDTVYNKVFEKQTDSNNKFFDCDEKRDCIGKKFLLFYRKDNPDSSNIDLENEFTPCK